MRESTYCTLCGTMLPKEQLHWYHGQLYCEHCLEEHTAIYYKCKERFWLEANCGNNDHYLCQYCYDAQLHQLSPRGSHALFYEEAHLFFKLVNF